MTNRELRRKVKALMLSRRDEAMQIGILEARTDIAKRIVQKSMPFETIADPMHLSREDIMMSAAEMTNG